MQSYCIIVNSLFVHIRWLIADECDQKTTWTVTEG